MRNHSQFLILNSKLLLEFVPPSMQSGVLRALEFDRIIEAVRGFALTPMGDELLSHMTPSSDPQKVAQLLAGTSETVAYLHKRGLFPLRASADVPQIIG